MLFNLQGFNLFSHTDFFWIAVFWCVVIIMKISKVFVRKYNHIYSKIVLNYNAVLMDNINDSIELKGELLGLP